MLHFIAVIYLAGHSPFIVPPPQGTTSTGVLNTGACPSSITGDVVCRDNNGSFGGNRTTDAAPQDLSIRPQVAFAGGTQTAADIHLAGGQDETKIDIDTAANCGTDTVTVTVYDTNGASTATVLTEATEWTKTDGNNAATATSLASAVNALAGVSASSSSAQVRILLDTNTIRVALAESDASCTTVATGTNGTIYFWGDFQASNASGPMLRDAAGGSSGTAGGLVLRKDDSDTLISSTAGGTISFVANNVAIGSFTSSSFNTGAGGEINVGGNLYGSNLTVTIADDGAGTAATCSISDADNRFGAIITCNDANGCNCTLDETTPNTGAVFFVVNVSANTVNFADSAGVQETAAPALGQYDAVTFFYSGDRWVQMSPVQNN